MRRWPDGCRRARCCSPHTMPTTSSRRCCCSGCAAAACARLAGMRPVAPLRGRHGCVRPLLDFTRTEARRLGARAGTGVARGPVQCRPRASIATSCASRSCRVLRQRWPAAARTVGRSGRAGGARPLDLEARLAAADLPAVTVGDTLLLARLERAAAIAAAAGAARLAPRRRHRPAAGRDPGVIAARHARGARRMRIPERAGPGPWCVATGGGCMPRSESTPAHARGRQGLGCRKRISVSAAADDSPCCRRRVTA